jgi:hypothetical protein
MNWRRELSKIQALFGRYKSANEVEEEVVSTSSWKSRKILNPACRKKKLTLQRCGGLAM